MKKIIMAVAAVAMAATMFAADVSAIVNGYGDFFSIEFKDGAKPNILGWSDPWDREYSWSSTGLGFAFSGDKAGASFELDNRDVTVKASKVWVQPVDAVKVTLGSVGIGLPKETIDWAGTVANVDYSGWLVGITPVDGLSIDLGLDTATPSQWSTNYWNGVKNYGAATMGQIIAAVTYGADFGTVKVFYDYNDKINTIGLDYAGSFGGVSVSPAVAFVTGENTQKLSADLYVQTAIDSCGINVYAKYDTDLKAGTNAVEAKAKITLGTEIGQAYFYAKVPNVLADTFDMTVKAGLSYSIGCAGMDTCVQFDVAAKKLSVPFSYKVSF